MMKVKCVDNSGFASMLEVGKEYYVSGKPTDTYYFIVMEKGPNILFSKHRFQEVKDEEQSNVVSN